MKRAGWHAILALAALVAAFAAPRLEVKAAQGGAAETEIVANGIDDGCGVEEHAPAAAAARWTAYDAARFGVKLPPEVPLTVQERAWASPIWYTP